ncbi:MAG TPA: PrsW family glutamic-type intramembrane protease [Trebonia sp.]
MSSFDAGPHGAQPGRNYPPPAQAGTAGGELRLSLDGRDIAVRPGQEVRIGRSADNDLVTEAPTVSRHHAVLRLGNAGWEFENTGSAPTFLDGQQVSRFVVDRPLALVLGSADGPVLRAEPLAPAGVPGQAGPQEPAGYPGPTGYPGPADYAAPGGYPGAGEYPGPADYPGPGGAPASAGYPGPAGMPGQAREPGPAGAPGWPSGQPAGPGWGAVPPPMPMPAAHHAAGGGGGDEMATALRILFPINSWLHNSGWRQGLRLLVIGYALLPLIFLAVLSSSNDLSAPGWAYSVYIAPLWIMGFWLLIRPGHLVRPELLACAGIVVWTLVWINVVTININDALHISGSISFIPALVIGFNEEITKALPVLLAGLILLRSRRLKHKLSVRMSMFLGTIAGLTFGIAEQAFYTSNDIIGINQAQSNNEAVNAVLAFAERIFVDGFQHAVWAGIAGFFIGMALNYPRRRIPLIALGVTIAAVLHALNDFLAADSVWLVIIVQAASLLLFLGYTMSEASIEQQVRDSPLFRGDSMVIQAFRDPTGGYPMQGRQRPPN